MMKDARRITAGETIETDVCVVGAGAAGITIALELLASGKRVVVLVGGASRERPSDRDLYHGCAAPGTSHEPLEENRRRCWGGTTTVWGGRCVPFDPIDFQARAYVPYSGWPISYEELLPYYVRANAICEAGAFAYDVEMALPHSQREAIISFDGEDVISTRIERWSPPTDFGRRYAKELRKSPSVQVLMRAQAIHLQLDPSSSQITRIEAATSPTRRFFVHADAYVLACGGLENARLLLASNDLEPHGVGNAHGNVGRYYMTHLMGVLGNIALPEGFTGLAYGFERDVDGVYCRRRIWVPSESQERFKMANAVAFFFRPDISNAEHQSALFSSTYLAKTYLNAFRRRSPREILTALRMNRSARREHWVVILKDLPHAIPQAAHMFQQRWLAKRRLPSILGSPTGNRVDLFYHTEHVPNPESRVELGSERDDYGVPRLRAHVAFSELDFDTVVRLHEIVADRLKASGIGSLFLDETEVREKLAQHVSNFNSQGHHLGTTRMSTRPEEGVVDSDCRVHGLANLYIAGGSVFPTSGHANPTLTIVALASRLANHLGQPTNHVPRSQEIHSQL